MAKKTGFAKYSRNPLNGEIIVRHNLSFIIELSRPALKVYVYIMQASKLKMEDIRSYSLDIKVEDYAAYYNLDLSKIKYKIVRGEILKGIIELLDKGVVAKTYSKSTFWLNADKVWKNETL